MQTFKIKIDQISIYHVSKDRYRNKLKKNGKIRAFCSHNSEFPEYDKKDRVITGAGMFYSGRLGMKFCTVFAVASVLVVSILVLIGRIKPYHIGMATGCSALVFVIHVFNYYIPHPLEIRQFEKRADAAIQNRTKVAGGVSDSTKYFRYKKWQKIRQKYADHGEIFISFEDTKELLNDILE